MDAVTRKEQYLAKAIDSSLTVPKPVTRQELFLAKLAGEDVTTPKPITREEMYLDKIVTSPSGGGSGGEDTEEVDIVASLLAKNTVHLSNNKATSIANRFFENNKVLESVDLPEVTTIGEYAFDSCTNLKAVNMPKLQTINQRGFGTCESLTDLSFPSLTTIEQNGLYMCKNLTNLFIPNILKVGSNALLNCTSLEIIDLGSANLVYNFCGSCTKLKAIIIRKTAAICKAMSALSFISTPLASGQGFIYVPSALVDTYKTASNWSAHASLFRPLEDYTVDGTVTGALDMSKI